MRQLRTPLRNNKTEYNTGERRRRSFVSRIKNRAYEKRISAFHTPFFRLTGHIVSACSKIIIRYGHFRDRTKMMPSCPALRLFFPEGYRNTEGLYIHDILPELFSSGLSAQTILPKSAIWSSSGTAATGANVSSSELYCCVYENHLYGSE